ncbi:integrase, catalytic region, zinc finger, CCHC-type containing protein [Tanacetum coccineum]
MTGNRSRLKNSVKKLIEKVRFENDHFGAIMGYGDYVIGHSVISKVYYVEGLGHNLFSIGQFCDSDLEVAFKKHSCYVKDVDGVELLKGCRSSNLYTIFVEDIMKSSLICLLSKASKNKSWLWHRRLNHLNFGTINDLARKDLPIQLLLSTYYQDAPSTSHSPSSSEVQPPISQQEPSSEESSPGDVSSAESNQVIQSHDHLGKWSKYHPMDNFIGNPSCPVSTRKQLATDALCKNMTIYQMDVKTAFLNGELEEEGLQNKFSKGVVDPTLFTQKSGSHILLIQIYIDDIIFASTDPKACDIFSKEMSSKFQMSMMGQMSFFLGLQVSQSPGGIFINKSKYALEILIKYGMDTSDPVDTPMVDQSKQDEDPLGIPVDQTRLSRYLEKYVRKCSVSWRKINELAIEEAEKHCYLNNREVLSLSLATMSSTLGQSTSTYVTISLETSYFRLQPAFQYEESLSPRRQKDDVPNNDTMADVNVNAPAKQAPAMAPPARTDDQILPRIR